MRRQQTPISSISWFGALPNGWAVERLKQVIRSVSSGVSVNASNVPAEANQHGVLKTSAISGGKFYPRENKVVWESELDRLDCPVTGDSLIISRMNTPSLVGESGYVGVSHPNLFLPDRLWQLTFNPERVFTPYISYVLSSPGARDALSSMATGTSPSMKNLSIEELGSLPIPLPSTGEQKIISAFLQSETSRIDCLIAKKERMLALLDEKRSALISRVVTRGLDANALLKPSGLEWLGEIPAHWQKPQLRFVCNSLQIGPFGTQLHAEEYVDNGIPLINPAHLKGNRISPDFRIAVDELAAERLAVHRLEEGDIVFGRRGELGRCGVVQSDQVGWLCGTGSLRARCNRATVDPEYVALVFNSTPASMRLSLESVGSTMDNLNTEMLGHFRIPLPPLMEQEEIVRAVQSEQHTFSALHANLKTSIKLSIERRAALITAAVTGQIPLEEMAQ